MKTPERASYNNLGTPIASEASEPFQSSPVEISQHMLFGRSDEKAS